MFRDLKLMTLDLLSPVRSKEIFQFIQEGPSKVLDHFDSVLFTTPYFQPRLLSSSREQTKSKIKHFVNCYDTEATLEFNPKA
jgi:hypothetical protein